MLSVLFTGFAPIAALVVMHHVFKHVIRAPSPFKLTSALAWGAAAGGLGAGLGAGLERRFSHHGRQAGRVAWGQTGGRLGGKFGSARDQRVGGMTAPGSKTGSGSNGSGPGGARWRQLQRAAGTAKPARDRKDSCLCRTKSSPHTVKRGGGRLAPIRPSATLCSPEGQGGWQPNRRWPPARRHRGPGEARLGAIRPEPRPQLAQGNRGSCRGWQRCRWHSPPPWASRPPPTGCTKPSSSIESGRQCGRNALSGAQDAYRTQMARSTIAAQNLTTMTAAAGFGDKAIRGALSERKPR